MQRLRLIRKPTGRCDRDHSVAGHQQIRNEIVSASSLRVLQVREFEMEGRPNHKTLVVRQTAAGIELAPIWSGRAPAHGLGDVTIFLHTLKMSFYRCRAPKRALRKEHGACMDCTSGASQSSPEQAKKVTSRS